VIIVIGAGPAGLAMAYGLQRRGLAYRVLERERVGAAWTHHYDRLHLHTLKGVSGLPGLPMPAHYKLGLPLPPGSPLDHFPVVGYELPQAVAAGRVATYGALVRLSPGMAHFADGCAAPCDAVILATGFRPALDVVAHTLELNVRGRPRLDRRWRAVGNPQLVCVGYSYPTTGGWLQAIGRVAHEAVEGIRF